MIPPIASRFVAGETMDAALNHAAKLNERDVSAILNLLGENYESSGSAKDDAATYRRLIGAIDSRDVSACISVKPSQIGLDLSDELFLEQYEKIVEVGNDAGVFVWLDMEDHTTTDVTLDAFRRGMKLYPDGVGVCLQANLKRTAEDIKEFTDSNGKIRLVKGAYAEPDGVAYTQKETVNQKYREYLEYIFAEYNDGIAVGSHDPDMISRAEDLHDQHGTPLEIQMLMGVRTDVQYELAADCEVYQYVPYGSKWMSYFYRRVTERKENLLFALRALVS